MTLLQTASNPYITILGPIESAAKRISIVGICNKIAGMIGILILVELLFSDTKAVSERISTLSGEALNAELDALAARVIVPYVIMAIVLGGLALMIIKAHLPEINQEDDGAGPSDEIKGKSSVFDFPHLILGVICIFAYVGVEVLAIDTIGLYGQFMGFDLNVASKFGIYSLIALTIGYLLGIVVIPKYLKQRNALVISATLGFVFAIGALLTQGTVSIVFIILLSFAHAFWVLLRPKEGYSLDEPPLTDDDPNNPWDLTSSFNQILNDGTFTSKSLFIQKPDKNTNMFSDYSTSFFAIYLYLTGIIYFSF